MWPALGVFWLVLPSVLVAWLAIAETGSLRGGAPMAELAHNFVRTLGLIESMLVGQSPPLIAKVYRPAPLRPADSASTVGRVEAWFPKR